MLEITLAQSNDSLRLSFYYAQLTTDRDTEINLYYLDASCQSRLSQLSN